MKKIVYAAAAVTMILSAVSCGNGNKKAAAPAELQWTGTETVETKVAKEGAPAYISVEKP